MSSPTAWKPRAKRQPRISQLDSMSILEVGASDSSADDASTVQLRQGRPDGLTSSGRQSRAKGATPRELADTFAKLLGGGSVLLAMWLDVEEAALTPDEASAIADPLARIINRASWGKLIAKRLVGADDYLALSLALLAYGVRIYPLVAAKLQEGQHDKPISPRTATAPVRQQSAPEPESNGHNSGGAVKFDPSAFSAWQAD